MEKSEVVRALPKYTQKFEEPIDKLIYLCNSLLEPGFSKNVVQYAIGEIKKLNKDYDAVLGLDTVAFPGPVNVHLATLVSVSLEKPLKVWKPIMMGDNRFYPRYPLEGENWVCINVLLPYFEFRNLLRDVQEKKFNIEDIVVLYKGIAGPFKKVEKMYEDVKKEMKKLGTELHTLLTPEDFGFEYP